MAKEKFIGSDGTSVPDPGLAAMQARVKAQQAANAKEAEAAAAPAAEDHALLAMRSRVAAQNTEARQQNIERDKATAAAAKQHLATSKKSTHTAGD